jgi:hypothetical protein
MSDDPIFEVIEAHRRAEASWWEATRAHGRREDSKGASMVEALLDAARQATVRLFSTTPTTLSGAIALLRYIAECEASGDEILSIDHLGGTGGRSALQFCHRLIEALERIESVG